MCDLMVSPVIVGLRYTHGKHHFLSHCKCKQQKLSGQSLCIPEKSEVSHQNTLIAVHRRLRLRHMLLSQPASSALKTRFPPPSHSFPLPLSQGLLEQTSRYPPISAVSLRPPVFTSLWLIVTDSMFTHIAAVNHSQCVAPKWNTCRYFAQKLQNWVAAAAAVQWW